MRGKKWRDRVRVIVFMGRGRGGYSVYGEWGERVMVFMGRGRGGYSVIGEWGEWVIVFMGSGESEF